MKKVVGEILRVARSLLAGATSFSVFVHGTNAKAEFDKLVSQAKHEFGSGGYTGTIAEKREFKIISDPVSLDQAEDIVNDKMSDADKWGPAFCIPVTGTQSSKTSQVKQSVEAESKFDAADAVLKMLKEKHKGFGVVWDGRPTVSVSKQSNRELKFVPKKPEKTDVLYGFSDDDNSSGYKSAKDAVEAAKKMVDRIAASGHSLPPDIDFYTFLPRTVFMTATIGSGESPTFDVEGKVKISKPSTKVEGFLFFGMASE